VALASFPKTWIGPGIPGVRDCDRTYCETPLRDLPSVQASDDLKWLEPLHPAIDAKMRQFRPNARDRQTYARNAKAILVQARELVLHLPAAFEELIQSAEQQDRFPSATACYFDLPEKIVPAPLGLDGHIIRFLNDQQTCVLWYLYLPAQGDPFVLASYPVESAFFLEELNAEDPRATAEATDATRVVARTFTEFLYRYWIENTIWFKTSQGIDLSPAEAAYIRAA
jgi:hypothetical protein